MDDYCHPSKLCFFFRWKRSVYKLLWKHMLVYAIMYVWFSVLYEFILDEYGQLYVDYFFVFEYLNSLFYNNHSLLRIYLISCYSFIVRRNFRVLAEHCSRYSGSINLMVMLGFFTSTAMQRLYSMQTPGTAKSTTIFVLSLKPNLPEVRT